MKKSKKKSPKLKKAKRWIYAIFDRHFLRDDDDRVLLRRKFPNADAAIFYVIKHNLPITVRAHCSVAKSGRDLQGAIDKGRRPVKTALGKYKRTRDWRDPKRKPKNVD